MHSLMPQEIEVWYVIPAVRRELAKTMVKDLKLSQKEIANAMGLTEAAVSQYLHSKRAKEVKFSKKAMGEIKNSAKKIAKDKGQVIPEMVKLTRIADIKVAMCDMHRKHDTKLPKNCCICFDEQELIKIR